MKKILIFILILLLSSCEKEVTVAENSSELQILKVDNIKNLLPLVASNFKTKTVFYNDKGDEIIFDFILQEELKEKKVDSKTYFAEEISGSYINESIPGYSLYFVGSGNYYKDESNLFVTAGINQFLVPGVSLLTIHEDGTPVLATYYNNIQLLDKEFEAVFSNIINPNATSFREIYYNATYGVIGFKDIQNDLYVLKGFTD
jgi:hypothetical protein